MRIAIVEDDKDGRDVLRELLAMWGHGVEAFSTGGEALERHGERPFDVAVIDLGLANVDGLHVARQLSLLPMHPLIIAYSGQHQLRAEALDAGCNHFILKPSVDELQDALKQAPISLESVRAGKRARRDQR